MDIKIKDNNKLRLGIIQLEYIESTGTQYIDTGIKPDNNNQTFKIGVSFLSNLQYIGSSETDKARGSALIFRNNNNDLCINWGSWILGGSVLQSNYPLETLAEIEIKAGNVVKLNGNNTTVTAQSVSFSSGKTANFILNGYNDAANGNISGMVIRTHYFIVENAGIETLHLIPAKNIFGVVCLYDTISQTFFYNQGTGDFVAGPVVKQNLPGNILLKTTTIYHKNTPNVDGLQLLNCILNAQETTEDVILNRIRADIGNVSGSLSELLQYAGMAGFNDNYEPQTKPRLVGTWTINDWYTTTQFSQAQAAFDGLTVIGDPNYVIDFSQMAVQVLDPNEDNYNPAVAIILQGQGLGTTMAAAPLGYGRWFLSKNQAAAVTNISTWFGGKVNVVDNNNICSNEGNTYVFTSFDELKYFTNVTSTANDAFRASSSLHSINIDNIAIFGGRTFYGCDLTTINIPQQITELVGSLFYGNSNLNIPKIPDHVSIIRAHAFFGCSSLNLTDLNRITLAEVNSFAGSGIQITELPSTLTTLPDSQSPWNSGVFYTCPNITSIRIHGGIKNIGQGAFGKCPNLRTIVLEEGVETIEYEAFFMVGFTSITLPSTLTKIAGYNFYYCNIPFLHLVGNPPTLESNNFEGKTFPIYVGDGSSAAHDDAILAYYLADTNWATYSSRLDTWYNYLHPTT